MSAALQLRPKTNTTIHQLTGRNFYAANYRHRGDVAQGWKRPQDETKRGMTDSSEVATVRENQTEKCGMKSSESSIIVSP